MTTTKEDKASLPPEAQALLDALDAAKVASHERMSIGLFVAFARMFRDDKLKDDQKLDLFHAGMHAHRMSCVDSFLDLFLDEKAPAEISQVSMAGIALMNAVELSKSTERFLTLCKMLEH